MIRVLIVHDTSLLRSALAALLGKEDDLEVATTNWRDLKLAAETVLPHVCVVDVDCPGSAGLADDTVLADLSALPDRPPSPGALSSGSSTSGRAPAWHSSSACLPAKPNGVKPTPVSRIPHGPESSRAVAATVTSARPAPCSPALLVLAAASKPGLLWRASQAQARGYVNKDAPPDGLAKAIRRVAEGERFIDSSLGFDFLRASEIPFTERELSVLSLAAEGASVAEIASSLHLSNGTVRNYMAAINRKTGARNRVDAIRISQGAGWV